MSIEKHLQDNTSAIIELTAAVAALAATLLASKLQVPHGVELAPRTQDKAAPAKVVEEKRSETKPVAKPAEEAERMTLTQMPVTREQVVAACLDAQKRVGKQPVKDVYATFEATKTSELKEKDYAKVVKKLEELEADDLEG